MAYALLDKAHGRILVQTAWSEKEVIKGVPGSRYTAEEKTWSLPLSWASCVTLRGFFQETLTIEPALNEWALAEIAARVQPATEIRTDTEPRSDWLNDTGLYPFQQADVDWLLVAGDALLANDMGTGKTWSILTAMRVRHQLDGLTLPALVVCPNSVKIEWGRQAAKRFPEAVSYVVDGTPAVRAKILKEAASDPLAMVVINIEVLRSYSRLAPYGSVRLVKCRSCDKLSGEDNLPTSRCEVHPKQLNEIPFKTVVVDEAHRAKDPKSKQTRALWAVCHGPTVNRRWGTTGTPIANHPGELWSVLHALSPEDFPTRTKFIDRYCQAAWNPYGTLDIVGIQPEHRVEFWKIVAPRIRRMPKALVLSQLPRKVPMLRYVDMPPKQAKAYRELDGDFVTRLESGKLMMSTTNMSKAGRLLQLASSYCDVEYVDPEDPATWKVTLADPSPKIDELLVVMDELGDEPFVACAMSRKLIELASARLTKLGVPHGLITGAQNTYERQRHLDEFQAGKTRCLLFTISAGGTGLTMTRAGTIVFLQRTWSVVDNLQAEDRVHRIGSEIHETVNVVDIVTRNTIEDRVQMPGLAEKFERLQQILRDRELLEANGLSTQHLDEQYKLVATQGAF